MRALEVSSLILAIGAVGVAAWTASATARLDLVGTLVGSLLVALLLRAMAGLAHSAALRAGRPL